MRVSGGTLCGRRLAIPERVTRPTQDRVRQALFSILADRIGGSRFLDLFAGSGAVGIDAWSRGASFVAWVESNPGALAVLRRNVDSLCPDNAGIFGMDVFRFLRMHRREPAYDLIYADPPYGSAAEGTGVGAKKGKVRKPETDLAEMLAAVRDGAWLDENGLIVMEQGRGETVPCHDGWVLSDERLYGDTAVRFFRRCL